MRTALFVTALIAATVEAAPGSYHRKIVRNTRQQLEHTYGAGMAKLWNDKGSMTPRTLSLDAMRHERRAGRKLITYSDPIRIKQNNETNEDNVNDPDELQDQSKEIINDIDNSVHMFMNVGSVQFDALASQAKWYGMVIGTQYNGLADAAGGSEEVQAVSNCFYAVYGEAQSLIAMSLQWDAIGFNNWFQAGIISPFESLANMSVVSEYCDSYAYIDIFERAAALDYSSISNQVVGNGAYFTNVLGDVTAQITELQTADVVDQYQIGQLYGQIMQSVTGVSAATQ